MRTIGQLCLSRDNNFDLIRLVLATCVLYTHSYDLVGDWLNEPVSRFTNQQTPASGIAVAMFFVISGFLVTQSWERNNDFSSYARKRIRRIMPGFIVAVFFCILIVGPLSAPSIREYFIDRTTYRFATLLCFKGPQNMHSVFQHNVFAGIMNGSLWTIRIEMICYVLVAAFGLAGLFRRRWPAAVFVGLSAVACYWLGGTRLMAFAPLIVKEFLPLSLHFAIGMAFYVWRDSIPLSQWLVALCVLLLALTRLSGICYTFPLCCAYLLFYIAFSPGLRLHNFAKNADVSYGLYLYAFPIQQLIVQFLPGITPLPLFGLACMLTSGIAFLSWRFVEKPCLRRKPVPLLSVLK